MKKATLITFCLTLSMSLVQAQQIKFTDISVFAGVETASSSPYEERTKLELNDRLNMPTYAQDNNYISGIDHTDIYRLGIMAGFTLKKLPSNTHKFRVGISGGDMNVSWSGQRYQNRNFPKYDSVISTTSGETIYLDSSAAKILNFSHQAQSINFYLQYIRIINPKNRLSAYVGAGVRFGTTLQNNLVADYHNSYIIDSNIKSSQQTEPFAIENNFESKTLTLDPLRNFNAHSLVGINYRFSNKTPLLRNTSLFVEGFLGLDYKGAPESNSKMGFNRGLNLGLRLSFANPRSPVEDIQG